MHRRHITTWPGRIRVWLATALFRTAGMWPGALGYLYNKDAPNAEFSAGKGVCRHRPCRVAGQVGGLKAVRPVLCGLTIQRHRGFGRPFVQVALRVFRRLVHRPKYVSLFDDPDQVVGLRVVHNRQGT